MSFENVAQYTHSLVLYVQKGSKIYHIPSSMKENTKNYHKIYKNLSKNGKPVLSIRCIKFQKNIICCCRFFIGQISFVTF